MCAETFLGENLKEGIVTPYSGDDGWDTRAVSRVVKSEVDLKKSPLGAKCGTGACSTEVYFEAVETGFCKHMVVDLDMFKETLADSGDRYCDFGITGLPISLPIPVVFPIRAPLVGAPFHSLVHSSIHRSTRLVQ